MAGSELVDELQSLQLMIKAVRKALREEDTEAALMLLNIAERLVLLSEVAEASAGVEEDLAQAQAEVLVDKAERD